MRENIVKLLRWQIFSTKETLEKLRSVRLKGYSSPLIYSRSTLSLERAVPTDALAPTQRYVLKSHLDRMSTLACLFAQKGLNLFALEGLLLFWTETEGIVAGPIPITPPIIEESYDENGSLVWLVNDGMHRLTVALRSGFFVNIILVKNVPPEWPYYAFPLPGGWADVEDLESLPAGYRKKIIVDLITIRHCSETLMLSSQVYKKSGNIPEFGIRSRCPKIMGVPSALRGFLRRKDERHGCSCAAHGNGCL